MKISYNVIVLLSVVCLYLSSCSIDKKTETYTIFAGKIENNATSEIRIENKDTVIYGTVDETGEFKIRFKLDQESLFNYIGNEFTTIYLSPGDSLFMNVDSKNWREFDKTLVFSGKGSAKNNYYFNKYLKVDELLDSEKKRLFQLYEKEFTKELDSVYSILIDRYYDFTEKNPQISNKPLTLEKENIDYLRKSYIVQYYIYNKSTNTELIEVPETVVQTFQQFDLNNVEHFQLEAYKQLVIDYFKWKIINSGETEPDDKLEIALSNIDREITDGSHKASTAGYFIERRISRGYLDNLFFKNIREKLGSDSYDIYLEIADNLNPLIEGDAAPEFKLFDRYGVEYTLEKFKGNYIYIDVWASYCGPCLREVPDFEQLKKDFSEYNISFISLSLDRKESDWLSAIKKHGMTEYQLKPKDDWSSDFVNDYSINHYGIPHYIIIDTEGKVIEMPAPKPSKVRDLLNQLLNNSVSDK